MTILLTGYAVFGDMILTSAVCRSHIIPTCRALLWRREKILLLIERLTQKFKLRARSFITKV